MARRTQLNAGIRARTARAPRHRTRLAAELGSPPGIKRLTRKRSGPDPLRSSPSTDIPGYGHEILVLSEPPRVRILPARFPEPLKGLGDSRSLSLSLSPNLGIVDVATRPRLRHSPRPAATRYRVQSTFTNCKYFVNKSFFSIVISIHLRCV